MVHTRILSSTGSPRYKLKHIRGRFDVLFGQLAPVVMQPAEGLIRVKTDVSSHAVFADTKTQTRIQGGYALLPAREMSVVEPRKARTAR